jgi:hypothetical protein
VAVKGRNIRTLTRKVGGLMFELAAGETVHGKRE